MDSMEDAAPARPADDAEDEMPLLFMDGLPSDFTRNAQLAALLTLMPSDDDAQQDEEQDDNQERRRRRRKTRRKTPYAREEEKGDDKPTRCADSGAKELSLYLSMFKVSTD